MNRRSLFTLCLAALASGLSACSSSTEPQSSNIWKSPDVGTVYVFNGNSVRTTVDDSTITQSEPGAMTLVATKTAQALGGKTNVTTFTSDGGLNPYISYEPNGDFSIGDSSYKGWTWDTYPTGSHTTITSPTVDSVDVYGARHASGGRRIYAGEETLTLAGRTFKASKIIESTYTLDSSSVSSVSRTTDSLTVWWVPELKMFGRWQENYRSSELYSGSKPVLYHRTNDVQLVMYGQHAKQSNGSTSN